MKVSKAFTLIELLCVIAIVLVLAAILFPVFRMAVRKAYETTDRSNLRQVYLATQQYQEQFAASPDGMMDIASAMHLPSGLLASGNDPVPSGALNTFFSECPHSSVLQSITPTNRASIISGADYYQMRVQEGYLFGPSPGGDSKTWAVAILPEGSINFGAAQPVTVFESNGPYFRITSEGKIIERDVQQDLKRYSDILPPQAKLSNCEEILLFADSDPIDFPKYCAAPPDKPSLCN